MEDSSGGVEWCYMETEHVEDGDGWETDETWETEDSDNTSEEMQFSSTGWLLHFFTNTNVVTDSLFLLSKEGEATEEEEYSSDAPSSPSASITRVVTAPRGSFSYILVGDNVDKSVRPRYMTIDHQAQSLHYFHMYAALDRIDFHHLDNDKPIAEVSSLPLSTFLPHMEDCAALRTNYAILLGRELVKSVKFFKSFSDYIPAHITHKYSEEMRSRSVVVGL